MKRFFLMIVCFALAVGFCGCGKDKDNGKEWVKINGVCWATCNVDKPGTFAANPEDAGMFYQWNRKIGWRSTGGTTWDSSIPLGSVWEVANDPCPPGYRVPNSEELETLLDETYVTNVWTTENGIPGIRFTDKANNNSIFLPAVGYRIYDDGALYDVGTQGHYWSSTQRDAGTAYNLTFFGDPYLLGYYRACGLSVRPVAK